MGKQGTHLKNWLENLMEIDYSGYLGVYERILNGP
jgi:hypothetical protein